MSCINGDFKPGYCYILTVLIKDENKRLGSSGQEMEHKLNELTVQCEELQRQHNEEAENCQLLKVPLMYLTV